MNKKITSVLIADLIDYDINELHYYLYDFIENTNMKEFNKEYDLKTKKNRNRLIINYIFGDTKTLLFVAKYIELNKNEINKIISSL